MSNSNFSRMDVEYIKNLLQLDLPSWQSGLRILGCYNPFTGTTYSFRNSMLLCEYVQQQEDGRYLLSKDNLADLVRLDFRFATFNQIKNKGWKLRKGCKARQVLIYKKSYMWLTKDHPAYPAKSLFLTEEEAKTLEKYGKVKVSCMVDKSFNVFHFADIEGIEAREVNHEEIDELIKRSGCEIQHDIRDTASYSPAHHKIIMPFKSQYRTLDAYYASLLHELAHWSWQVLDRYDGGTISTEFASLMYAREELVAEIVAATMTNRFGIDTTNMQQNHQSYLKSWATQLSDDDIAWAISKADEVVHYFSQLMKSNEISEDEVAA